ncbi:MAG TPA: hypothetical protein VFZ95_12680 [Steroidobacteraceae bacterium]
MVRQGRTLNRRIFAALALVAVVPFAHAGDDAHERPIATAAPLEIPHTLNLLLAEKSRKRNRKPGNIESFDFLDLKPGLVPVTWPRYSDVRTRILTPELKRTPVVGWLAENLYRSKKDDGWCVEADPGEGEYMVFYRFHPKR